MREALAVPLSLDRVLVTPGFLASAGSDLPLPWSTPLLSVLPAVLARATDSDSPQGILAVARLPRSGVGSLPIVDDGVYLLLDSVQDPGNLGALARVAEATGCAGLALTHGCAHPNHPRALRASAGSLLRLPVAIDVDPDALAAHLSPLAPRWLALTPRQGTSLWRAALDGALVLALGAEGPGLSQELLKRCRDRLRIPMAARLESLNVAVAGALVLFERTRRRGDAG